MASVAQIRKPGIESPSGRGERKKVSIDLEVASFYGYRFFYKLKEKQCIESYTELPVWLRKAHSTAASNSVNTTLPLLPPYPQHRILTQRTRHKHLVIPYPIGNHH